MKIIISAANQLFLMLILTFIPLFSNEELSRYQTLPELEEEWRGLETAYPSLAKLHSIGQSVQGRNIIVLQVSEYQTPCLSYRRNGEG